MRGNSNQRDLENARRMRAKGVPLDLATFDGGMVIRQRGGHLENSVASSYLTRSYIGVTVTLYIKLVGNRSVPFEICGMELYFPWKDTPANLLPDPADAEAPQIYTFAPHNVTQFDKSELILRSGKTLRRGPVT